MRYFDTGRFGAAVFVATALLAGPGLAQQYRGAAGIAASNGEASALAIQAQQQLGQQQMYTQGQLAIQGSTQAHAQSEQMLSTLSERNQAQLDAQAPRYPTSPTTTGDLH
jgi:hypothetical protein